MKAYQSLSLFSFAALAFVAPLSAQLTDYNWVGPADGGLWSEDNNWSGEGKPNADSSRAILGNTATDRLIVLNNGGGAPGIIGAISFVQTSAANNVLEIRRSLGIRGGLEVGANNDGRSILYLNTMTAASASPSGNFAAIGSGSRTLNLYDNGMKVNSGGTVIFAKTRNDNSTHIQQTQVFNASTFDISGGELIVQNGVYTSSGNATRMSHRISQGTGSVAFTMSSGRLEVGATSTNAGTQITDTNLEVGGSVTITGGTTLLHLFSANDAAKVTASGAIVLGGDLLIDITAATITDASTFALFAGSSIGGSFDSVAFANSGEVFNNLGNGVWALDHNGFNYSFSENNGLLSVTQIPEPASIGLLAGAGAIAFLLRKRRTGAR